MPMLITPNTPITNPDDMATLQACQGVLSLVRGEWEFDRDEGLPLFSEEDAPSVDVILTKAPDLDRIRALVRRQLLAVRPGLDVLLAEDGDLAIVEGDLVWGRVSAIVDADVTASFDEQQRQVTITFVAYTAEGAEVRDTFPR